MSVRLVIGILGNITTFFLYLSPAKTFWGIVQNNNTEQFSCIPYVMTFFNCLISIWYGLPFVSPNNILLVVINGIGALFEVIYIVIFFKFSPWKKRSTVSGLLTLVLAVFATVALVSFFLLRDHSTRQKFCGVANIISCTIMYSSPLSVMWRVIKTKSVEFMPFWVSLFILVASSFWFIFGLLGHDLFVVIPNGAGCVVGVVQLILYGVYCGNKYNVNQPYDKELVEQGQAEIVRFEANHKTGTLNPSYTTPRF